MNTHPYTYPLGFPVFNLLLSFYATLSVFLSINKINFFSEPPESKLYSHSLYLVFPNQGHSYNHNIMITFKKFNIDPVLLPNTQSKLKSPPLYLCASYFIFNPGVSIAFNGHASLVSFHLDPFQIQYKHPSAK